MKKIYSIVTIAVFFLICSHMIQGQTVKDSDGNIYSSVKIGTQVWMAENLKTTKFNDGTAIPLVTDIHSWNLLTTPACCWFNNDASFNKRNYGALYNWYTVNTNKLCPEGWHVPADVEWTTLITYLCGDSIAGGKLKEKGTIHWEKPNYQASNESGFNALPSGYINTSGVFTNFGKVCFWWSATEYEKTNAWNFSIDCANENIERAYHLKKNGYSVRCIKDNEAVKTTISSNKK
jgi:uncharacterized protein (TIGR02145 family)